MLSSVANRKRLRDPSSLSLPSSSSSSPYRGSSSNSSILNGGSSTRKQKNKKASSNNGNRNNVGNDIDVKHTINSNSNKSNNNANNNNSNNNCSFCLQVPAAVTVSIPVLRHRNKRIATPYCLTCYYTTAVVRYDAEKYVSIFNEKELQEQLPPMQQMFNDVYLELQKEMAEESERAFLKQQQDPLASMLSLSSTSSSSNNNNNNNSSLLNRRMIKTTPKKSIQSIQKKLNHPKKDAGNAADGGFLQNVPLPDRLLQTQKQQALLHEAQMKRMNDAALGITNDGDNNNGMNNNEDQYQYQSHGNLFKRRKSSGRSIWNLAMDPTTKSSTTTSSNNNNNNLKTATNSDMQEENNHHHPTESSFLPKCSCGSKNVQSIGNMTSRNQDMRKGETWGMKDRGNDVVSRYQCDDCGKTWNEEE